MNNQAVGYCRLSDRRERSQSIPSQKKDITDYCQHNNLELLQIFVDDGKSGWTFDRPGFIELEAFCKKNNKVAFLIIPHFDRFSRADPIDAMVKERYFRDKLGVKVLQITERIDVNTNDSTYQMLRFMQAFTANEERKRIVERTTKAMRFRMLQGRYCAMAPLGYKNARDDKNNPIIIIDPDKAPIIKFIFEEFMKGSTIKEIGRSARLKGFSQKGHSQIRKILNSPFYAGMINVPAYQDQPEKLVKSLHEPIISAELYWQVQQELSPKKFISQRRIEVPLRGVLRCQVCGKLLTAAPSKGRKSYYWYYFCTKHRKENYSAIRVHDNLNRILDALSLKTDYFEKVRVRLSQKIADMINSQTKELMKINLEIARAERSITDIEEKYLLEAVSKETYKKIVGEKQIILADLLNRKENFSFSANDYLLRLDYVLKNASSVRTVYNECNMISKQRFIKQIFGDDIRYTPDGFRTPFLLPLFYINEIILNDLPLIIEDDNLKKTLKNPSVTLRGALTNLTWEEVKIFFDLFAA